MNIYKKLLAVQKELKGLSKDKKSFNYDYVTGNKLLGFIKPIMNEQGLILKQEVTKVETERIQYKTSKGTEKDEVLYKVWQKFTWIDIETGDKDENEFFSSGMNEFEKGLGSALTYAERYFLLKYFHIATDEDDIDNSDRKAKEQENDLKEYNKKMDVAIKYLVEFVGEDTEKFDKVLAHMNKTFSSNHKGFNTFKLEELESYIKALINKEKNKNKDLEKLANNTNDMVDK